MKLQKFEIESFNKLKKLEIEIKKLENLSNAYSKKISELENYMTLMITITFGNTSKALIRPNLIQKNEYLYYSLLRKQYKSLMFFIKKLRKTKLIKNPIYYFTAFELQQNGNLHIHMHLALNQDDLQGFINFIYWYKNQKFKNVFNIGRTHIGLSTYYRKIIENELLIRLTKVTDKTDSTRIMYIMNYLETRNFNSGEATFWEFLSVNDLKKRYNENIINYIKKTVVSQIDLTLLKIGTAKNWTIHNIKEILNSINNSDFSKHIKIIRKVGQVYTFSHSLFVLKFKLYQNNYSNLIQVNPKYKSYYRADKDFERNILQYINNQFFYRNTIIGV